MTCSSWFCCVNFYANMLTECHAIEFLNLFFFFCKLWGIIIITSKKEIRKSMNFKQDSEREIKRRERQGELGESDCDLSRAQHRSQHHPYLPEEIWNKFLVQHIPFQTSGTISIFTTHWNFYSRLSEEGGGAYEGHDIAAAELDCCSHTDQATLSICKLHSKTGAVFIKNVWPWALMHCRLKVW